MLKIYKEGFYFQEHINILENIEEWEGKHTFNKKMKVVENVLKKKINKNYFKKSSYEICSACPEDSNNGIKTSYFSVNYKQIVYIWPEGYRSHYIKKHNFVPTKILVTLINNLFNLIKSEIEMKKIIKQEEIKKQNILKSREKINLPEDIHGKDAIKEAKEEIIAL